MGFLAIFIILFIIVLGVYSKVRYINNICNVINNKDNIVEDVKSAIDDAKVMYERAKKEISDNSNNNGN